MNRYQALALYAFLIILTGVALIILAYNPSRYIEFIIAFCMFASAFFAFISSYKSEKYLTFLKYNLLHAFGMVAYGFAIIFYANNMQKFIDATTFFMLYYGFTEIIFCFQLLVMKINIVIPIIIFRMFVGLLIIVASFLTINAAIENQNHSILGFGTVFILMGLSIMLFRTAVQKYHLSYQKSEELKNAQPDIAKI